MGVISRYVFGKTLSERLHFKAFKISACWFVITNNLLGIKFLAIFDGFISTILSAKNFGLNLLINLQ